MASPLSSRLRDLIDALPLRPGLRVLEIGCGPGAAAREVARRVAPGGYVLAIDRSAKAIEQAMAGSGREMASGALAFRQVGAEAFEPPPGEPAFDLAFAFRVGALDGRHPEVEQAARAAIKAALKPDGLLLIDGGDPLRTIEL